MPLSPLDSCLEQQQVFRSSELTDSSFFLHLIFISLQIYAVRLKDAIQQPLYKHSRYQLRKTIAASECLGDLPKSLSISVSNVTWRVLAAVRAAIRHRCAEGFQRYAIVQDRYRRNLGLRGWGEFSSLLLC